jgi:hypothetical protein
MSVNIFQRDPIPLRPNPFTDSRRDGTSKPIAHGLDRAIFDAPWQKNDFPDAAFNAEQQFQSIAPTLKRDVRPFVGQLPYATTPKMWITPGERMIPAPTRVSRVCFNEAVDNSGPFYLRRWQIWDNAPFLPSAGDVANDPRYSIQTKTFTTEYNELPRW